METVLRAVLIYIILIVLLRFSGKRTLAEITAFDFILLLIIGEATQQALLGEDFSLTTAALVILTLIATDLGLQFLKQRSSTLEKWLDGAPLVLIEDGKLHKDRMSRERVDETDILEAGRKLQRIERLDQIKYTVMEKSGGITIIPKK
jgi:uncharacterized membrane protein YcaP (DUF421 family)